MNVLFFGLGRIGLPQALVFASKGIKVYGYDLDKKLIGKLKHKKTYFFEPMMDEYLERYLDSNFFPIEDWQRVINQVDYIVFTLGTKVPDASSCLTDKKLDVSLIENILMEIFDSKIKKGIHLVFRTTLPVGSIDYFKSFLEKKFILRESRDFYISFVPERLAEGNAIHEEETLPKIIGSYTEKSFSMVQNLFNKIGGKIIRVPNPKTAEFCKLTDNTYRNTMFAYVNDLAVASHSLDIDLNDVLEAVNDEYDRNLIPKPGFVSGYCLGKDPYILEYSFPKKVSNYRNFDSLWYYGRRVNDFLYKYVVTETTKYLKPNSKKKQVIIGIIGLSFKENIDDFRMSHAFNILDEFIKSGFVRFKVYDPNLNKNKYTEISDKYKDYIIKSVNKLNMKWFSQIDILVVAHMHHEIKELNESKTLMKLIGDNELIVFDGWNVLRELTKLKNVKYQSIGFNGVNK